MASTNALHSLYGGKASRSALAGNVGGQSREQTVLTPPWLIAELTRNAGMPLALDPCTAAENPTGAEDFYTGAQGQDDNDGLVRYPYDDGLRSSWFRTHGYIYVNPPYADLEVWLRKCSAEGRDQPIYALIPFRPHRQWFGDLLKGVPVVSLAPFAFVGQKSAFPAPLCLACWNLPAPTEIWMPAKRGRKNLVLREWRCT